MPSMNRFPIPRLRRAAALAVLGLALCQSVPALAQESSWPADIPQPGPPPKVHPPVPQVRELDGGITLWHVESSQVPLVSLTLLVRVGSVDDPAGRNGLAALTAQMLDEGAGERDAFELADAFDLLGASYSLDADRETSRATLQVLRRNLPEALDLFADVVLRPRFENEDWVRLKQLWINNLKRAQDDPTQVARRITYRVLLGDDHPYADAVPGRVETVQEISLQDVKQFHERHWRPDGAMVISAGAISADDLRDELQERLGSWKRAAEPADEPDGAPSYPFGEAPRLAGHHMPRAGAAQTVIRIAGPGISRDDPIAVHLALANNIFGASFTSRLMQKLREDKGYTYGAGSAFNLFAHRGLYLSGASVRADVTAASLVEFQREYEKIVAGGVEEAELAKARASLRNEIVERLQTLAGTTSLFAGYAEARRPPDYAATYLETIRKADVESVNAAIRKVISWKNATVIVVGDLQAIRSQLEGAEGLELGELVEVDAVGFKKDDGASEPADGEDGSDE